MTEDEKQAVALVRIDEILHGELNIPCRLDGKRIVIVKFTQLFEDTEGSQYQICILRDKLDDLIQCLINARKYVVKETEEENAG